MVWWNLSLLPRCEGSAAGLGPVSDDRAERIGSFVRCWLRFFRSILLLDEGDGDKLGDCEELWIIMCNDFVTLRAEYE
jgi:hypothetical protein